VTATKMQLLDIIDKRFSFEEAAKAFQYLWSGNHVGKIVIEMI
jgi:NADPH:quinone reductase-like Zn-dependent oxidoreductase